MTTSEPGNSPLDIETLTRLANDFMKMGTEPQASIDSVYLSDVNAMAESSFASANAIIPSSTSYMNAFGFLEGLRAFGGGDIENALQVMTPQIEGVVYPAVTPAMEPFSFIEQGRRIDVIPSLEPMGLPKTPMLTSFTSTSTALDVESVRRDFPILHEKINGYNLIWLDNAATTQKPQVVIDRLNYFYSHENSNIHRAAHELAARSTDAYEAARESVRRFLNAPSVNEIVFVRGATEAINLVAQSWGRQNIQKDDEIVITWLEHHANIVPWQMLCSEKGARLKVAPVDDHGQILLDEYERLLSPRTRLVSFTQVSNALGTVTPVNEMVEAAHRYGAKVLVDGAQAVSHMKVDVQLYDCDFYVFSGHKVFAPTGIGVLYGKSEVLEGMRPWQGGGNMIKDVTFERTTYQAPPLRFEAGTGTIGDAIGLGAAIEYLERIGMPNITRHENELMAYGTEALKAIPGLHLLGTAPEKAGVLSFVLDGFKTEEVSSALNQQGIAVRAGHHCAQPILRRLGFESSVRPSLALYNTCEEIDALIAAIWRLKQGRGPVPL
jgi:cysteine desulfurase/selenocysteine lyase